MDLHLESAEYKVGGFSLDLMGRDEDTDEVVIIENQFGQTDHRHLGQLLTYAGGTEPATVVWIAEGFRDEHRAALDWLNSRTDSDTRFFGVRLGAVTLAGAPQDLVAPLLELVVKPNDWGKEIRKAAASTGPTSRELLYQEFWGQWLERVKHRHWTNKKAPTKHWLHLPSGAARSRYTVSFRSDGLLSELFFSHPEPAVNLVRWQVLADQQDKIENVYGAPLIFDDLPKKKGCRIGTARTTSESVENRADWEDYMTWFEDTQVRLRAAVMSAGGLPPLPLGTTDSEAGEDEE